MLSTDAGRIAAAIPEYEIERELGRGGMGVVYLGRHRRLDRGVAIKELPRSFALEEEVRARFSTEAQTLAGLSHPHIVPIFDYVEREGLCLIVMEQLPGGTVWDRFTTTGLTPPTTCGVVMACCAALQYAHDKSVLHLDVKPDNLMFDAEAAVKVTDFGIARVITGDRTLGTVDGQVLGTPAYMSPEQARGDELTPASDVYATGVMLYELLSGQLPWLGAQTASELLSQRLSEDPIPLLDAAPHIPSALAGVVMKAISRDNDTRYQRAEDFGVAIGEACATSWGDAWLDVAGVHVFGSGRLNRAARTSGAHAPAAPVPTTTTTGVAGRSAETVGRAREDDGPVARGTVVTGQPGAAPEGAKATGTAAGAPGSVADEPARETVARGQGPAPAAPAPQTGAPGAPAGMPEFQLVKAGGVDRIEGADLYDLELADLIGVEDVLDPPEVPKRALVATAALVLLTLLVALIGIGGRPSDTEQLQRGDVVIDGEDVAAGDRIELDLATPLVVGVRDRALAARTDEVEVAFGYLGGDLTKDAASLRDGIAIVDPGTAQRLVGGSASATVRLKSGGEVLRTQDFAVHATQTWYLTLPFIGGLLVLLLGIANLESSLKPLRSGRIRKLSYVGAVLSGPIIAVSFVVLAGAFGANEPNGLTLVIAAVLGAVGGVTAVRARVGLARRRRVRKAVKRAERWLRTTSGTPIR